jgi:hypothetical protein
MDSPSPISRLRVAVVCVADNNTKYLYQSLRFIASLMAVPSSHDIVPFVGYFPGAQSYFLEALQELGANIVALQRYSAVHGPSNKMAILKFPGLADFDSVLMCDCDIVFIEPFDHLLPWGGFQAKISDFASIPGDILARVFQLAARDVPQQRFITSLDRQKINLYCNAGFLIFSSQIFKNFTERWFLWNDLLLDHQEVLAGSKFFTDQASLCLAAEEFSDVFRELDVGMNFPTHMPREAYPPDLDMRDVRVMHYHDMVDPETGLLAVTQFDALRAPIAKVNAILKSNRTVVSGPGFWDFFYSHMWCERPLSRSFSHYRRGLVRQVIIDLDPASILDLGCGGLPLVLGSADYEYVGIDYASEAIAMACANDPCGDYRLSAIHSAQVEPADLVLLVDVLPYQSDADALHDILEKAAQSARIWILLSVLEQPPDSTRGPARYFHQPVDDLLARIPSFNFQMLGFASGQRFYLGQTAMRCDTRRGQ